jgi:hypothetical protein
VSASWQRWLRYAKAKLDSTLKEGEADLDEREARLRAEAEGKPWLSSTSEAPTFDEMRARIEHDAREAAERQRRQAPSGSPTPSRPGPRLEGGPSDGSPATGGPPAGPAPASGTAPAAGISTGVGEDPLASFDMAAHEKAADERLAAIRKELGLAEERDEPDGPAPPSAPPSGPPGAKGPVPADPPSADPLPPSPGGEDGPDDTPVAPV